MKTEEQIPELGARNSRFSILNSQFLILPFCILAVALFLRAALLDRHGLWNDELRTATVLRLPLGEMVRERLSSNHMPLYFVLAKGAREALGESEAALRALSALFGVLAVWATMRLGRRIGGARLAIALGASAAIHEIWLSHALEARMYSILMWASAESFDAYLAWTRGERSRVPPLARWAAVSLFGLHVHLIFFAVLLPQLLDAGLRRMRGGAPLKPLALALAAVALATAPTATVWFANQSKFAAEGDAGESGEREIHSPGILLRQTYRLAWGDYDDLPNKGLRAIGYVALAVACAGWIAAARRAARGGDVAERRALRDAGSLAIAFGGYMAAIYVGAHFAASPILGSERYYAHVAPLALALLWGGLAALAIRRSGLRPDDGSESRPAFSFANPFLAATLAVALALQAAYAVARFAGPGEGFREAVAAIEADLPPGRAVVGVMATEAKDSLGNYYGKKLPPARFLDRHEDEKSVVRAALREALAADGASEFWLLTYHDKMSPVWKVVERAPEEFPPIVPRRAIGEANFGAYRYVPRAPDAEEAAP